MSYAQLVNDWFREKIATGPLGRDTEAYNQAYAAKVDLIARLDALAPPGAPAEPKPQPEPEPAATDAAPKE